MKPVFEKVTHHPQNLIKVFRLSSSWFDAPLHYHPELELVLITKGNGKRFVGDSVEQFEEGDIVLVGGGLPHFWKCTNSYYQKKRDNAAQALVAQYSTELFGGRFLEKSEFSGISKAVHLAQYGLKLQRKLKKTVTGMLIDSLQLSGIEQLTTHLRILDTIGKGRQHKRLNRRPGSSLDARDQSKRFKKIHEHIIGHYSEEILLDDLADIANMNKASFCRYFKKQTGRTLVQYVNEMRITYACKLMQEGSATISAICFECGFNNLSNFNRHFKSLMGKTPSEYMREFNAEIA